MLRRANRGQHSERHERCRAKEGSGRPAAVLEESELLSSSVIEIYRAVQVYLMFQFPILIVGEG